MKYTSMLFGNAMQAAVNKNESRLDHYEKVVFLTMSSLTQTAYFECFAGDKLYSVAITADGDVSEARIK